MCALYRDVLSSMRVFWRLEAGVKVILVAWNANTKQKLYWSYQNFPKSQFIRASTMQVCCALALREIQLRWRGRCLNAIDTKDETVGPALAHHFAYIAKSSFGFLDSFMQAQQISDRYFWGQSRSLSITTALLKWTPRVNPGTMQPAHSSWADRLKINNVISGTVKSN